MAPSQRVVRQRDGVDGPETWKVCRSPRAHLKVDHLSCWISHISERRYSELCFQKEKWNIVSIIFKQWRGADVPIVPPIPHPPEPSLIIAFITGAIDTAGGCQKTWMYPQLIIQTTINHPPSNYTPSTIPLIDFEHTLMLSLFHPSHTESRGPCKAISSCSIYPLDWNCVFDHRDDGAGVLVRLHVSERPRSITFQSHGVAAGPCYQTVSFVQLLIGVIYCPNRRSSCGFTA